MHRKRLLVLGGIVVAVIACLAAWRLGLGRGPQVDPGTAERLALAARWMLVPALTLMAGIGATAGQRFVFKDLIDGGEGAAGSAFDITQRYNRNTLEQTALAAVAWTGLALTLKPENLSLIPALATLFGVGRAAFWIGYLAAPWARAAGMAMTFYPTGVALVWLAVRAVT